MEKITKNIKLMTGQKVTDVDGNVYQLEEGDQLSMKEGIDSDMQLIRAFNGSFASDVVGSLWDSMYDTQNMAVDYASSISLNKGKNFRTILVDLYYELQDYENNQQWKTNI